MATHTRTSDDLFAAMMLLHIRGLRAGVWMGEQARVALQDLAAALVLALDASTLSAFSRPRQRYAALALLSPGLSALVAERYAALAEAMASWTLMLAERHADTLLGMLAAAGTLPAVAIHTDAMQSALASTLFPSAILGSQPSTTAEAWWLRQGEALAQRLTDQVQAGVTAEESASALARRIVGTESLRGKDGVIAQAERSAVAVAQAQAAMATQQAMAAVASVNPVMVDALRHESVLDERTTEICRARDGNLYDATTHVSLRRGQAAYLSGPPYHFGCRSMMVFVLAGQQTEARVSAKALVLSQNAETQQRLLGEAAYRQWQGGMLSGGALMHALTRRPLSIE